MCPPRQTHAHQSYHTEFLISTSVTTRQVSYQSFSGTVLTKKEILFGSVPDRSACLVLPSAGITGVHNFPALFLLLSSSSLLILGFWAYSSGPHVAWKAHYGLTVAQVRTLSFLEVLNLHCI